MPLGKTLRAAAQSLADLAVFIFPRIEAAERIANPGPKVGACFAIATEIAEVELMQYDGTRGEGSRRRVP